MEELTKIVESNAKAIAALTDDIQEMKRDRDYMYRLMGDLTSKIAALTDAQAQSYETMKNLDERQRESGICCLRSSISSRQRESGICCLRSSISSRQRESGICCLRSSISSRQSQLTNQQQQLIDILKKIENRN